MAAVKEVPSGKLDKLKKSKKAEKAEKLFKSRKSKEKVADEAEEVVNSGLKLVQNNEIDAGLDALFASSSGPVTAPKRSKSTEQKPPQIQEAEARGESEASDESSDDEPQVIPPERSSRKRARDEADIEDVYMEKLAREERLNELARAEKQRQQTGDEEDVQMEDEEALVHESLLPEANKEDNLQRTAFLSNVAVSAITSKAAKKTLLTHLSSFLAEMPPAEKVRKIESIRFRSTAYASPKVPKKAGFALKEVQEATTKSTNAYVVYSIEDCVAEAIKKLNGSVVLDRHLRVDSAAHPAKVDNKRCVFVGNLDFVNDEQEVDEEGKKKKRAPSDIEEGLWVAFSKAGKVENVRVVRDEVTRVGKGIAYVQFENANAVEAALLFNDQKFPPLLPRKIRVARAKAMTKTGKAKEQAQKFDRRPKQADQRDRTRTPRTEGKAKSRFLARDKPLVFEGQKATRNVIPSLKRERKKPKGKGKGKPTNRSARRGAAWKAENK